MNVRIHKAVSPFLKTGKRFALNPMIQSSTGLVPITKHQENDVFIVGYPKSGNTWFQNLVSGVVFGINPQYSVDSLVRELVPDIHQKQFYNRFRTPMFFKSHSLPQQDYRNVVYLLRDGRDVMVSYYHYLTNWHGKEVDFKKMVATGEGLISKWKDHVEAWLANPYDAEILMIKYENLLLQPVRELQRFCDFVGEERDLSWLEQVSANAVFEKMQSKEKAGIYFDNPIESKDRQFFRRGIIGSYKDEMPPEVLSIFLQEAQGTLLGCGYPVENKSNINNSG